MEMVKLKQEVEPWGPSCLFTFCEIPTFQYFRISQQKQMAEEEIHIIQM